MITPWEVKGKIDYEKILREFGAKKIDKKLIEKFKKPLTPLIKRGLYFAHRDLDKFLKSAEEGKKIAILTGRGPSGKMHIGHLIPFILAKWFQDNYDADVIIPISDDEKFYVKEKLSYENARKFAIENAINILSLGFKKGKTKILIDFENTEIYRFAARIAKKITLSNVKEVYGMKNSTNIGWIFYPAINIAHILLPSLIGYDSTLVPIGIDQDPHVRLARDIAPKLNLKKPAAIHSKFIPSLVGESKMSTTLNETAIWLDDNEEEIKRKLMKYALTGGRDTAKEQIKLGGNPEKCIVFKYLEYIFENDDKKLKERNKECKEGKILCGECKKYLANKIYKLLNNLQQNKRSIKLESYMLDSTIP